MHSVRGTGTRNMLLFLFHYPVPNQKLGNEHLLHLVAAALQAAYPGRGIRRQTLQAVQEYHRGPDTSHRKPEVMNFPMTGWA